VYVFETKRARPACLITYRDMTMPGVQKPHCDPCISATRFCTGCRPYVVGVQQWGAANAAAAAAAAAAATESRMMEKYENEMSYTRVRK